MQFFQIGSKPHVEVVWKSFKIRFLQMCVIVDTHKICLINVFRVSCTVAHNNNNKSRVIEVHQSGCEERHRELSRWNKCSVPGLKSVFVWETMPLVSYTSNKSCIKVTHADRLMMSGHKKIIWSLPNKSAHSLSWISHLRPKCISACSLNWTSSFTV